ncbi:hypothetical protein F0562_028852 [Nyssa sinensis]|uniref:Legume lectin domain-containing protein n=1 Tax=Nyssa sinensis TaxID=561372 RepID=A0A5J5B182_9ASTE|nr:hypothetical protein F0562_028852 [Nyssa sinensis]
MESLSSLRLSIPKVQIMQQKVVVSASRVMTQLLNSTDNPFVAVEFDIYQNNWDPEFDRAGIDINSMQSVTNVTWSSSILDGKMNDVWITYDSSSKNPSVVFTAATGNASAIHSISSWNFSSSLEIDENIPSPTDPGLVMPPSANPDPKPTKNKTGLVAGSTVGACILVGVLGLALFSFWKKEKEKEREREREREKERQEDEDHDLVFDVSMNEEFETG